VAVEVHETFGPATSPPGVINVVQVEPPSVVFIVTEAPLSSEALPTA
jgi:hypothetical protein